VLDRIIVTNASERMTDDFWFYTDGQPNFYSANTIVQSLTTSAADKEQAALACFGLFDKYYAHFDPATESGLLREPTTLLAVFGWGRCDIASDVFATLCELAGCVEPEVVGHSFGRVRHDDSVQHRRFCGQENFGLRRDHAGRVALKASQADGVDEGLLLAREGQRVDPAFREVAAIGGDDLSAGDEEGDGKKDREDQERPADAPAAELGLGATSWRHRT